MSAFRGEADIPDRRFRPLMTDAVDKVGSMSGLAPSLLRG